MSGAMLQRGRKRVLSVSWLMMPGFLATLVGAKSDARPLMKRFKWGKLLRFRRRGKQDEEVFVVFLLDQISAMVDWIESNHALVRIPYWMNDTWIVRIASKGEMPVAELLKAGFKRVGTDWVLNKPRYKPKWKLQ